MPGRLSCFHSCSQTLRRYLRHTARWVVVFISLHILMQTVASFSFAVSVFSSVVVMAMTLSESFPTLKFRTAFTSEPLSVKTEYRVGAKFLNDSISLSFPPFPGEAGHATVLPTRCS